MNKTELLDKLTILYLSCNMPEAIRLARMNGFTRDETKRITTFADLVMWINRQPDYKPMFETTQEYIEHYQKWQKAVEESKLREYGHKRY